MGARAAGDMPLPPGAGARRRIWRGGHLRGRARAARTTRLSDELDPGFRRGRLPALARRRTCGDGGDDQGRVARMGLARAVPDQPGNAGRVAVDPAETARKPRLCRNEGQRRVRGEPAQGKFRHPRQCEDDDRRHDRRGGGADGHLLHRAILFVRVPGKCDAAGWRAGEMARGNRDRARRARLHRGGLAERPRGAAAGDDCGLWSAAPRAVPRVPLDGARSEPGLGARGRSLPGGGGGRAGLRARRVCLGQAGYALRARAGRAGKAGGDIRQGAGRARGARGGGADRGREHTRARCGAGARGLSAARRSARDRPRGRGGRHSAAGRALGPHLRTGRRDHGRALPRAHPLHVTLNPLSSGDGVVRRLPAVRHPIYRGEDGERVFGAVVHLRRGRGGAGGHGNLAARDAWARRARLTLCMDGGCMPLTPHAAPPRSPRSRAAPDRAYADRRAPQGQHRPAPARRRCWRSDAPPCRRNRSAAPRTPGR